MSDDEMAGLFAEMTRHHEGNEMLLFGEMSVDAASALGIFSEDDLGRQREIEAQYREMELIGRRLKIRMLICLVLGWVSIATLIWIGGPLGLWIAGVASLLWVAAIGHVLWRLL